MERLAWIAYTACGFIRCSIFFSLHKLVHTQAQTYSLVSAFHSYTALCLSVCAYLCYRALAHAYITAALHSVCFDHEIFIIKQHMDVAPLFPVTKKRTTNKIHHQQNKPNVGKLFHLKHKLIGFYSFFNYLNSHSMNVRVIYLL